MSKEYKDVAEENKLLLNKKLSELTKKDIDTLFALRTAEKYGISNPVFTYKIAELEKGLSKALDKKNEQYFKAHCYLEGSAIQDEGNRYAGTSKDTKKALELFEADGSLEGFAQVDKLKPRADIATFGNIIDELDQHWNNYRNYLVDQIKETETLLENARNKHPDNNYLPEMEIDTALHSLDEYDEYEAKYKPAIDEADKQIEKYTQKIAGYQKALQATDVLINSLQPESNTPKSHEKCLGNYIKHHCGKAGQDIVQNDKKEGRERFAFADFIISAVSSLSKSLGDYLESKLFKSKSISAAEEKLEGTSMKDRLKNMKQAAEENPDNDLEQGGPRVK